MITLVCPNCAREFPVMPVESDGFCACGLDFRIPADLTRVEWKPDPNYPTSGARSYTTPLTP